MFTSTVSVEIAISGTWAVDNKFSLLIDLGNEREGKNRMLNSNKRKVTGFSF
jgi:hypothetical protein